MAQLLAASYNLNGIRSALDKGLIAWLESTQPDIFMVQELKALQDQVPMEQFHALGYEVHWHSAQKKGYSGVAIFTKHKASFAQAGIGIEEFDAEGRLLRVDIGDITFVNSYFPSGTTGDIRQTVKEAYLEAAYLYVQKLLEQCPKLVVSGDFNICHKPIDINNPQRQTKTSGFLPNERAWMDRFEALGLVDSFRSYCSLPEQYSWWSYRAGSRQKNVGWRIDYHWVSKALAPQMLAAKIDPSAVHSDHCPVLVQFEI